MTRELQRAMARYEEARGNYRVAVLGSLVTRGRGAAIRAAIEEYQAARAELGRLTTARAAEAERVAGAGAPCSTPPRPSRPVLGVAVAQLLSLVSGEFAGGFDP
jgi:hypothetical protein